jgi:hypothetical protein
MERFTLRFTAVAYGDSARPSCKSVSLVAERPDISFSKRFNRHLNAQAILGNTY